MSLDLVLLPKCCQKHGVLHQVPIRAGCILSPPPLISEPVLAGESVRVDDGELTYTGAFSLI